MCKWSGLSNFFYSQTNMFLSRLHGQAQTNLFRRLYGLYEKGISLLPHSSSIGSFVTGVLCNSRLMVWTDEHTLISEIEFDVELLFYAINRNDALRPPDLKRNIKFLHTVEQLIVSFLSWYQLVSLQNYTAIILKRKTFKLH